ncbi:MAG: GAF domain-containing protein [Chloroflexi bacterium]|nr:GAF domain-containing protein [Chloroflexota bacterium]
MAQDSGTALLSVAQAATLLGVHPNTIRAWTDAGRLTAYRINTRGDRRFRRDDVQRLLVEDAPAADPIPSDSARHRRDPQLSVVERIAAALAASPSPGSVARAVVEALRTEIHVTRAAVYLVGDEVYELVAHAGFPTPPPPVIERASEGSEHRMIELRSRQGTIGLLVVDPASADAMAGSFTETLATLAGTALASSRLIVHARRELRRARALRSVTKELTGTLDLNAVLGEVVELTRTLFEADKAGLWILDDSAHPYQLAAQYNLGEQFLAQVRALSTESETIGTRAVRDRRSRWLRNADTDESAGLMRATYAAEGIRTACLVPLVGGDQTLGLLGLYHRTDRPWPDEEVALLQAFADQAAVAIQNARLYRSVADQAARMKSIQDLSARLNRLTDVRAIAEAIVAEATSLAVYHDIRVYQVDWDRRMCDPIAFTREMLDGDPENAEDLLRVAVGEGFTGWVAEHGEPLLINDAIDDERGMTIEGTDDVPESMLVVPMTYEGRTIGVIVLSQLGYNRFSNDDLQTMRIFAGYAAQAVANATTYGQLVAQSTELARRSESQRHLLETNARLLGSLEQADVLETIADGLRDVVAYDNLSIYRTDPVRRVMMPVLTRERHADEVSRYVIPFGHGLMGWAVEQAQPLLANDALNDPRAIQIPGTPDDPEAIVVVPLIADGEVLGALNASRIGGEEVYFTESDFELIQLFAAQASIALRNADRHHAVSLRAETDALTGLGNHGAFQRELGRMVDAATAAASEADRRLAVLMMDLDAFKGYNDRHGHPAGDALLYEVATAIYGAARTDDRVFRYGGDEFALILPGATVVEAERVGERICAAVSALTADSSTPVTITVGVAGMPDSANDRAGLVEAADVALFFGKRAGENRVIRSDQLPRDVVDLRGTLDELASAALRDGEDPHAVEHLMERATQLSGAYHEEADAVRAAVLTVTRSLGASSSEPDQPGRGERVGVLAGRVAERVGLASLMPHDVELAARLSILDDRSLAELSAIPSLHAVATLIAGYRSLMADGVRRSRRAVRARGPVGPHVIAAASAYDELVAGGSMGRSDAMQRLREHPATFRSDVLAALAATVDDHADAGRRRRSGDRPDEARGAA